MDALFRNNFSCLHIYTFPTLDLETLIYLETDGYQTQLFLQIRIYWELLRCISAIDKKAFRPFILYLAPPVGMLWPVSSAGGQAAWADFPELHSVATELSSPEGNLGKDSYLRWPDLSFGAIPLLTAAAPSHILMSHWLHRLFKEEIFLNGNNSISGQVFSVLQTLPSKINHSWPCVCSFTRHQNIFACPKENFSCGPEDTMLDRTNSPPTSVRHLLH